MENLAKEIIAGKRLTRNDNLKFLLIVNLNVLMPIKGTPFGNLERIPMKIF